MSISREDHGRTINRARNRQILEGTVRQQRRGGQHPQHTRQRRETGERREPAEIPGIVRRQRDQQHGAEDHRLTRLQHHTRA